MRFGVHVAITGGFAKAAARGSDLGCDAIQIFCKNPRAWGAREVRDEEYQLFRAERARLGIWPVVVHVSYLVNLASPREEIRSKSIMSFEEELRRCEGLGADFVVLHPGSPTGSERDEALRRVAEAIGDAVRKVEPRTMVLLENVAGSGSDLGGGFDELAEIVRLSGLNEGIGLCLDTCHAFARGWDVASAEGLDYTLGEVDRHLGLECLKVIHLNDCKGALGSRLDRHDHIGRGEIGMAGFDNLINHPKLSSVPSILETPQDTAEDDPMNLSTVRSLDRARAQGLGNGLS